MSTYVPGICNIGPQERKNRLWVGVGGLIATILLAALLIAFAVAPFWRITLFCPAAISALGFLQYGWHFCAAYGLMGVFNVGPDLGKTDTVEQSAMRRNDRRTAWMILFLSGVVGVLVAGGACLWPSPTTTIQTESNM